MHACGHDVHTAVLLGTASVLAENKALFRGNVKLFFQPAEEGVGGAKRMIAAGCMENPHVEAVFGLHSAPRLPAGKIGTKPGWTSASSDEIKIRVHGKSAHGASPDEGVDAIYIASQLVVALYGLMARRVRGTDSIALNVGKFHAGNANNIICECAELEAMYRTFRADTRQRMKQEICDLVHSLCKGFGGWAEITIEEGYDGHANDADRTRRLMELSRELMGEDAFVLRETPDMGTEDFCYFGQKAPAVFFDLGTGSAPGHPVMPLHSSRFTVDEGIPYLKVQQCNDDTVAKPDNAHVIDPRVYELGDIDITGLFTGVTIVQVTDRQATLRIAKTVEGEHLPPSVGEQEFTFTITLKQSEGGAAIAGSYPAVTRSYADGQPGEPLKPDPNAGEGTITFNDAGQATVTLRKDQCIVIGNLPVGAWYEVAETNIPEGYAPDPTYQGDPSGTFTDAGDGTADVSLTVTNTYTVVPVATLPLTGSGSTTARGLLLAGGGMLLVAGAAWALARRRRG